MSEEMDLPGGNDVVHAQCKIGVTIHQLLAACWIGQQIPRAHNRDLGMRCR
jgi:hypothetical protein